MVLAGLVNGAPEVAGTRVRFVVNVKTVELTRGDREPASGAVTVWADLKIPAVKDTRFPHLSHGDTVTVAGHLDAPSSTGPFDYAEHLLARGIGSVLSPASVIAITPSTSTSALARVHRDGTRLADAIERHVPEPQAAVASALSLGVHGGITSETNAAFRDSGLTHLLAVSGLHVGVLLATILGLAARLIGRHRVAYLIPPLVVLWLYILLVGAPPSTVCAGLMGTAYLVVLALLTHADADHANGILELARRGRVGTLVVTPALESDDPELWRALQATGTSIEVASRGATVNVGDLAFDILHPPNPPLRGTSADANNNSLTSLLRWGTAAALFTGGLHITDERFITGEVDADLLQVGHHGSATSSDAIFLDAFSPLADIISAGHENRFGHPKDAVFVSDGQRWYTAAIAAWPAQ